MKKRKKKKKNQLREVLGGWLSETCTEKTRSDIKPLEETPVWMMDLAISQRKEKLSHDPR